VHGGVEVPLTGLCLPLPLPEADGGVLVAVCGGPGAAHVGGGGGGLVGL